MKKLVYIAGPMRGCVHYNFESFDFTADQIRRQGYNVISPADMDRAAGFDGLACPNDTDWTKIPDDFDMQAACKRDAQAVMDCDMVYLLTGWETSKGAQAEVSLAIWLGKDISYPDEIAAKSPTMPQEEVRIVDPVTGGAKGSKPARFDLIPPDALWEVAEVYGAGCNGKYEPRNWEKGYAWGLSFASLNRHIKLFEMGERIDNGTPDNPGTGKHHMACAVFHALALLAFDLRGIGTDDRPKITRRA